MEIATPTVRFGSLTIGAQPQVVGTITSLQALRVFPLEGIRPCDVVEVRLDQIGVDDAWLELCQAIERSGCPVLLTLRSATEGGDWRGSDADRLQILKSALPVVAAVDIELNSALESPVSTMARELKKPVVISFHDFDRTPDLATLEAIAARAARPGAVVKIAAMIQQESDIEVLRQLLAVTRPYPLCVIGMGNQGTATRVSFAQAGSCLTYGYLDVPAAPGQLSAAELIRQLREE